jgi:hypothetical protein
MTFVHLMPPASESRSTGQELLPPVDPVTAYNLKALRMLSDAVMPRNFFPHESVCPCGGLTFRDGASGLIGCRLCGEAYRDE